jgi:heme exporter protein A
MSLLGQPTNVNRLVLNGVTGAVANNVLFEDIHSQVSSGQLLRISGDNGAGKSTLLKMIVGLLEIEAGDIRWNDQPIDDSDSFQADLSYVGHKDGLKGERTAIENLAFYQQLYQQYEQNLDQLLFDFNLLQQAEILAKHLSFGQRRRLALLRLAISNRPLWVVDEPFTGIDVNARVLIEGLFTRHLDAGGIIVMTHHGDLMSTPLAAYLHEVVL